MEIRRVGILGIDLTWFSKGSRCVVLDCGIDGKGKVVCERVSSRKSVYYLLVDECHRSRLSRKGDAPFHGYSVCQTLISVSVLKCES